VEDEGEPLGRGQGVQHHEEGQPDRVGEQRLVLGLETCLWTDDRVGQTGLEGLLAPPLPRAKHVQTDAGDDRRQPATHVLDVVGTGPADPDPGVLQGVVGLGQ
jgi:hypothetical protein